ncbi:PAS domain-containing sensor histidine kinase [Cellulophaga omnivescoria]|uniref:PAS domain-containing sensor histidine kinase n=1 Tax=Cellulophaga omnivescoria TaxID=1888890 RepID=UPI0009874E7D|nr:sensor histidine kinase [Cellulophaga omnivescoria]WBU89340.1 PAS domain S-box protein [Cellulophaga omnivescoria]WKB81343.1 PAS domain S-box protein [Cellulophaga lytica]
MHKAIEENPKIKNTLERINNVARIGIWELNLTTKDYTLDKITSDILDLKNRNKINLKETITLFKDKVHRKNIKECMTNLINNGDSFDEEVALETITGKKIWARKIGLADKENGIITRVYGIFQEITEIKKTETQLHSVNSELKSIINSSAVSIVSIDKQGDVMQFNSGAEKLLGFSAEEVIGNLPPTSILLKDELASFSKEFASKFNKEHIQNFNPFYELGLQDIKDTREWTFRKKNGTLFPVELSLTPLKNDLDEYLGILGIFYDITDRKKAEAELLKKNQLLNYAEQITMMGNWSWNMISNEIIWSANMYNIFGRDPKILKKVTFDTYFNHIHPEDRKEVSNFIEITVKEDKFTDVLHRIVLEDGTTKTVHLLGELITNELGEPIEMIGTCQDVTQLRMAEIKFRGLLESAPDAMLIVDEEGTIQISNKQAEKLFGYPSIDLKNKPVELLIPEKFMHTYKSNNNNFFTNIKTSETEKSKELYALHKNGEKIPIQISLSPLETEEGLLISVAIRDITEQKHSEYKILKAKERLEVLTDNLLNKNRQLADFAHITSHNLRAPVSNLNSLLGFYNSATDEEDKAEIFGKFEIVIGHLTETLDTLVEALKTSNGAPTELKKLNFEDILNKTKEILTGEIEATNATIISDFSLVDSVLYSKLYLESIFLNLMSNALKYKSPDRDPVIELKTTLIKNRITLTVKDNGLGIDLEKHGHKLFGLNKVFHRHPQAKGIGLFMTKVQIESLGGTISAKSQVNEGTTFIVTLN